MKNFSKPVIHIFILLSLLAAFFGAYPATPAQAAGLPVAQLLNADGTLAIQNGYSGPLNTTGYDISLDPVRGPVFSPLMTVNNWSALGSGLNGPTVRAIAIHGTDIYVAGLFTDAGGDANADRIAKWDGSSWSALGSGIDNGLVYSLAFNGSNLYVGGNFTSAGGVSGTSYIAQWDGSSWSTLGNGLNSGVNVISVSGSDVYIGGNFLDAGGDGNADYIAKLDGDTWSAVGQHPLNQAIYAIAVAGSTVYAGGDFTNFAAGGNPNLSRIAVWDSDLQTWTALGSGLNNTAYAIIQVGSDLYVGGAFVNAGGDPNANHIAKWNGSSWSALGSGIDTSGYVDSLVLNGSNLYVGGFFSDAGGASGADYIARWDGSSWSALGATPLNQTVNAILINGLDLYAGGDFSNAGGDLNADKIALFQIDSTPPTVNSFTATSPTTSLDIPITAFTASDNIAVTGYKITESSTPPAASAAGWTASAPSTYTVSSSGNYTLYPWAKDASGNVSAVYGSPASVTVDATAPTVNSFTATSPTSNLNIPITAFTASDNVGVSGYQITESSTPPSAGATGWTVSAPTSYTVSDYGDYILYAWAKDALGNISAAYGSPAIVTVCAAGPITVTSNADSGAGSLRKAIADACVGATINFNASLSGATIRLNSVLTIFKGVTIDGSALASQVTISGDSNSDGNGDVAIFMITSAATVTLDSLTLTKGHQPSFGGAIYNGGSLTIRNSTISGSSTTSKGGGIYNDGLFVSALTVVNSTITGNSSADSGGGIANIGGTMTIVNSTISGNSAQFGGGIFQGNFLVTPGTTTLLNATLSGNTASAGANSGGGIEVANSSIVNYANTIIANSTGGDCSGAMSIGTNTNNLVEDGSCSASLSGDPLLGSLASNGGPTQTLAILSGLSPAFDAGDDATCAASPVSNLDQRGVTRPSVAHCDIGAFEYVDNVTPTVTAFTAASATSSLDVPITAFTASDDVAVTDYLITESSTPPSAGDSGWAASAPTIYTVSDYGSQTLYPWAKDALDNISAVYGSPASVTVCNSSTITVTSNADSGAGSLRKAIADACADDTINFDSGLSGGTIYLASTLTLSKNVTIDGSALASQVAISGDSDNNGTGNVRIFSVNNNVTATLNSLTITKGSTSGSGGGIFNQGVLTVTNSTFLENTGHFGGAIYTTLGSLSFNALTVTNSTFSGNTALSDGGAIFNNIISMTITNSTFSGNIANNQGGAIFQAGAATTTLRNSTISGNTANAGGGIYSNNDGDTLNYANTIIANSTGGDCSGSVSLGTNVNNLVEDGSCSALLTGNPLLGSLASNGGSTQTLALLANSPAIDAGDNATCAATPVSNLDQRGVTRPSGAHCDIGAYEYQDTTAPNVTAFAATSPSNSLNIAITNFTASDDVAVSKYLITESSTPPVAGDSGWAASAPTTYTVSNYGSHTLYPWAKDAIGNVSTVYGSPAVVTACVPSPITVTSNADNGAGTLRQAIAAACAGDTINFNSGLSGGTIYLTSTLTLSKNVTIDGSALASQITISGDSDNNGSGDVRVFYVNNDVAAMLDSLTITKGSTVDDGGGVYNSGALTVMNSTFFHNIANSGGGIFHDGLFASGSLTVINSTFTANTALNGGGIGTGGGTITIANSTIAGNAAQLGGGVFQGQGSALPTTTTLLNTTISDNSSLNGGGIYVASGTTLNYANTIIANSGNGGDCVNLGALGTNTNNLVEDASCSPTLSGDPLLGSLASNGGPTQTLALLAGSPAINAGDDATCAASPVSNLDQRGVTRPSDSHCDIGAFEYVDNVAPTVSAIALANPSPTNLASVGFTVTFSESVTGVDVSDFSLTTTGVTGASITGVTGFGTTRTVTVSTGSGNGTIRLGVLNNGSIKDIVGNALNSAFTSGPSYTVDKTVTLTLTSSDTQDGWVLESSETSKKGGTINSSLTTFRLGDDATKKQYLGILSFNTGTIPDTAVITGVTLKVKQSSVVGGGNPVTTFQGFMVDIKKGLFGTAALQTSDFQATFTATTGKTFGPFKPTPVSNWYSISLTSGATYINKLSANSGLTQIRLHFKLDDNNNTIANYLSLFSGNASAGSRPQLVITYTP